LPHYVIHRTLTSDKVLSGLHHSDEKHPDGISYHDPMVEWYKLLVWDATSPDTFASSYVWRVTSKAGAVTALAEDRKRTNIIHTVVFIGLPGGMTVYHAIIHCIKV